MYRRLSSLQEDLFAGIDGSPYTSICRPNAAGARAHCGILGTLSPLSSGSSTRKPPWQMGCCWEFEHVKGDVFETPIWSVCSVNKNHGSSQNQWILTSISSYAGKHEQIRRPSSTLYFRTWHSQRRKWLCRWCPVRGPLCSPKVWGWPCRGGEILLSPIPCVVPRILTPLLQYITVTVIERHYILPRSTRYRLYLGGIGQYLPEVLEEPSLSSRFNGLLRVSWKHPPPWRKIAKFLSGIRFRFSFFDRFFHRGCTLKRL